MVVDTVTDQVLEGKVLNNDEGRFLVNRLMWLVSALGLLPSLPDPDDNGYGPPELERGKVEPSMMDRGC